MYHPLNIWTVDLNCVRFVLYYVSQSVNEFGLELLWQMHLIDCFSTLLFSVFSSSTKAQ
jgi:hypothetical protein